MYQERMVRRIMLVFLALLTAFLPFAAPQACSAALADALRLCGGSLLLALFPFLIVSALLVQCGAAGALGVLMRPAAWLMGFRAQCSGGILLIGLLGGFAPAANATAEAFRAGLIDREEAASLLPACICSGPSFVVLSVGAGMLGSFALGVRLFAAQVLAGYLTAGLLRWAALKRKKGSAPAEKPLGRDGGTGAKIARKKTGDVSANTAGEETGKRPDPVQPPQLYRVIADSAMTYLRLCGFILYFRLLSGGLGALLPPDVCVLPAILLEVCSGCSLAAQTGRWASVLCCAALSLQGASVLMQVRTICPREISFAPLLKARVLHLPLSLLLFRLLLPQGAAAVFSTLCARVITMRRVPPDCALLVFFGCCLIACRMCRTMQQSSGKTKDLP